MSKIFQIGFNKCGTTSMYEYFLENNINSIHWRDENNVYIANKMYNNIKKQSHILKGLDGRFVFFSDMERFIKINNELKMYHGYTHFKILHEQYPGSKFIFNTRNVEDWLLSRIKHEDGRYLKKWCKNYNKNEQQIINMWREHFYEHTNDVTSFFEDKQDVFLNFKLGESSHKELYKFLYKDVKLDINITLKHIKT